jgi:hypothetical protein
MKMKAGFLNCPIHGEQKIYYTNKENCHLCYLETQNVLSIENKIFPLNNISINKNESNKIMSGWKTWLAVIGALTTGAYLCFTGHTTEGIASILYGLSLLGIGGKLDKIQNATLNNLSKK